MHRELPRCPVLAELPCGRTKDNLGHSGPIIKHCPACPGQVQIGMGQVKLGIHLPDEASKNISDLLFAIPKENPQKSSNRIEGSNIPNQSPGKCSFKCKGNDSVLINR